MAQKNNPIQKNKNLDLSIQIHLSGLSFCILDKDYNSISYLKNFHFDRKLNPFEVLDRLKHFFSSEKELNQKFNQILVIHDNELSTLVANSLFNKDSLADYLKFNAKILKSDFIAYDFIKKNDCVNVYVPYVNINNFIYDKFGSFTYKHFSTVLIDTILTLENDSKGDKIYVHVANGHFEILVIKKGRFELYNTFPFNTKEDFIYYILFTFEQLKLDAESDTLILLGYIKKEDDLYSIIYKYIRNVNFLDNDADVPLNNISKPKYQDFIISNSF